MWKAQPNPDSPTATTELKEKNSGQKLSQPIPSQRSLVTNQNIFSSPGCYDSSCCSSCSGSSSMVVIDMMVLVVAGNPAVSLALELSYSTIWT